MKTIFKFPLMMTEQQRVAMPIGAQMLTVQMQNDTPCLWALVDKSNNLHDVKIFTVGTGHEITRDDLVYIGTYQVYGGKLIFHVFRE